MSDCLHEKAEPVMVDEEVVAEVCVGCLAPLPPNWGCEDCQWIEAPRRMSQMQPDLLLGRPCRRHV